jgi:PilZ domain
MSIHHLKNLLIESLVLGALVFYLAMMIAALVGLASWILGGQEFLLKASWVGWCVTIAMVPFALRIIFGPDARVICNHCRTWMERWLKHPRRKLPQKEQSQRPQKEQRQFPRYPVKFPARLATDHRPCGFGMIGDLSVRGCRVKSKTTLAPGDFGKLLINLPTGITPLTVSLTSVRWVNGYECGLEFILMDRDEQGCLNRQLEPVVAVVP